jgi:elongation factor 3
MLCWEDQLMFRMCAAQANGAGKSTLIKLLTGEMQPQEGAVWKHPNTRLAYVAQHAFHHLEKVRFQGPRI